MKTLNWTGTIITLSTVCAFVFLSAASASVPNCGAPLEKNVFYEGFNLVTEYYPAGNCDTFGIADSTMDCMRQAEKSGYSCYQIANRVFSGRSQVITPRCFACLN